MPKVLVTYDLPSRRYTEVESAIKALGNWAKVANTAFIIDTSAPPAFVRDVAQLAGGADARIIACDVGSAWAAAGQPPNVIQWLQSNLQ